MQSATGSYLLRRRRPPSGKVPSSKEKRNRYLRIVRKYVHNEKPVPPLSQDELLAHADSLIEGSRNGEPGLDIKHRNFIALLVNNELWKEQVAGIPYHKRLLLLPQCLRDSERCPASFDAFGLVCDECGACPLGDLQTEAERLGYNVLIAEGSPVVMSLIETGEVEAIVGVSCLSVLEKVFPYMEAASIPGLAVPLLNDGCADTSADLDWVWDAIHITSDSRTCPLDINSLRSLVASWFTAEAAEELWGPAESETAKTARDWLVKAGKRWRPFLVAAVFQALKQDGNSKPPYELRKIAFAVECFHKASLVHDDIEDGDALRYGENTLHKEHGIPVALNVGDFLLGEGYRLITESQVPAEPRAAMLKTVAEGHRTLCLGQGAELNWKNNPAPLSPSEVLEIFGRKTSPAFEVALLLGAIYAGADGEVIGVLSSFSKAAGIAYQIQDDLDDFAPEAESSDLKALRPSLLLSFAHQEASGEQKERLEKIWRQPESSASPMEGAEELILELGADKAAYESLEYYKSEAIRSLCRLRNWHLKALLRRVVAKIFREVEMMGCCNDYQASDAPGSEDGSEAAA